MKPSFLVSALLVAASPVAAEIVDIQWAGDGRYQRSASIAPGKFLELCGRLPAGLQVRWHFETGAPMDFNVHYHLGKEVVFPFKLSAVASARDTLDARIEQDYCWMWSNKSAAPITLRVTLQR